ncbi:MAG: hypothetical protein A2636_04315 [Elusimicrobia bacterium RIFCSPHIGHO2_01_FULL_64_10]|nr:MAG: hypothetical protein A2636_04315 [Elusimicrobia bacterium RIFCSPHIGHO2_01_FULL_64_10]
MKIGKNKIAEKNVVLGAPASRKIAWSGLAVGSHARLRSGTVIYRGTRIGDHLETGHNAVIREENEIGDHFSLWSNSVVDYGCRIGRNVKIHCNCYVAQFTTLEDDVFLAPGVVIANDLHPGAPDFRECMKGPLIKKGAQIGCNVTILPHVTIGEYALIGAGSVVTRDIPAYTMARGSDSAKPKTKIYDLECRVKPHLPYQHLKRLG